MSVEAKHPAALRLIHWLMALFVFVQAGLGMAMPEGGEADQQATGLLVWHVAVGLGLLVTAVVRVLVRLSADVPALPAGLPRWQRAAARINHVLLYVLMFVVPVLGYLAASGDATVLSALGLPRPLEAGPELHDALREWHGSLAFTLLALVLLHAAAALKHRFLDDPRNDVLRRMV